MANFFKNLFGSSGSKPEKEKISMSFNADSALWRNDAQLKKYFTNADFPDDLQLLLHEGGYRKTKKKAEYIWVRTTGRNGKYFRGTLINEPQALSSWKNGDELIFITDTGTQYPLLVSEKYMRERADFIITPCDKCGLSELFDPPYELMKLTFTNLPEGAEVEMFTTFCNICGGVQGVTSKSAAE